MSNAKLEPFETKMTKTLESLEREYQNIRAGRANPHLLDKLKVDYYGAPTPIQQVGNISVAEARVLVIQPWEPKLIKAVERAILASDIGITPTNDGHAIRLVFPELTEERRKELAKDIKKKGEQAKVAVRNIRRDGNETFKKQLKDKLISEDEQKDLEKDLRHIFRRITRQQVDDRNDQHDKGKYGRYDEQGRITTQGCSRQ